MRKDISQTAPGFGDTFELHRARSQGVLNSEELAYCREHRIPVGYDCIQIGWVPLGCEDDIVVMHQATAKTSSTTSSADLTRVIEKLKQRCGDKLLPLIEALDNNSLSVDQAQEKAATVVASLQEGLKTNTSLKTLDRCHCVLQNEVAKHFPNLPSFPVTDYNFSYRSWSGEDISKYCQILGNANVWEHLTEEFPSPFTEDLAGELIEIANMGDHHEVFAIEYQVEIIGQLRLLFNSDYPEVYSAEIAYLLGEEYWGRGLMPKILSDFTRQSFQKHPFDFMYVWIEGNHKASIKCAERSGFRRDFFDREEELANLVGRPGFLRYICHRPK